MDIIKKIENKLFRSKVFNNNLFCKIRRHGLINTNFSCISNNCWGGVMYEYYGLQKQSPTVGGYFFAEDYIKFVKNLKYYCSKEIEMISLEQSKHREKISSYGGQNLTCPIGRIEDIEFVFMHYTDAIVAKKKWERRVKRINFDNLIFKFSNQNECSYSLLKEFDDMELPGKKIFFVNKPEMEFKNSVYYPGYEDKTEVTNDTLYWNRYFDVKRFLNGEGLYKR